MTEWSSQFSSKGLAFEHDIPLTKFHLSSRPEPIEVYNRFEFLQSRQSIKALQ